MIFNCLNEFIIFFFRHHRLFSHLAALENKDFYSIYRKNTCSFNRLFLSQRQDKYKREERK